MGLKINVDKLDDIDAKYHDLYTEKDGKYVLTGVEGMKTQDDINRLQTGLVKERDAHKQTKERFALLGDRKIEDVISQLDRIPELEAAAAGKIDDEKLNGIVESRLKTKIAPLEREIGTLKTTLAERDQVITGYTQKEKTRSIHDSVREAATKAKLLPEAIDDALMLAERVFEQDETGKVITRVGVGVTPGIDPTVWLTELQGKRPHWWGPSNGGGAGGNRTGQGGGSNPWSRAGWNMTEQGRMYVADKARAEQMARSAGTTIGGPRPEK